MDTCDKDVTCEAVECAGGYCSWWKNGKCNESHAMSTNEYIYNQPVEPDYIIKTCFKRLDDKGNFI